MEEEKNTEKKKHRRYVKKSYEEISKEKLGSWNPKTKVGKLVKEGNTEKITA